MLQKIWNDDRGALLSAEWVFLATIIVIGLIAGMVQIRNAIVGEMAEIAGAISALDQSYGFTGLTAGNNNCCFVSGTYASDAVDFRQLFGNPALSWDVDNDICE